MELDHMLPQAAGGPDTIDNAIPVCFECHAESHVYNDKHPRGRKYRPEELRRHKEQWLEQCKSFATFLASAPTRTDVGPLQALIDELEFNEAIASHDQRVDDLGAPFEVSQFNRCIAEGILSLLEPDLKSTIYDAYVSLKHLNSLIAGLTMHHPGSASWADAGKHAQRALKAAKPVIVKTLTALRTHLSHD
jgi:hypothetical protein